LNIFLLTKLVWACRHWLWVRNREGRWWCKKH